jgi:hypothetical protein
MVVLLASALAVGLPRWFVRSAAPYNWDAANFTLAVDGIDLAQHRPHPPPAIAFVLGGRLLRPLVGGDAHAALVLENVLFAVLSCVLVFAIALAARGSPARAWLAWLVFATSVQHAFNTVVAEVYMSELATTLLVAWLGWRALEGSGPAMAATGLALAAAGAFRLTGMVFMIPLAVWVLWRAPVAPRWKRGALVAFVAGLAAWIGPLVALAGPDDVVGRTWLQFTGVSGETSVVGASPLLQFNRNLRDVVYSMATGIGLFNVLALPVVWFLRRPAPLARDLRLVCLLWLLPGFLFFVFVHMGKAGYTLLLLPVMAIVLGHVYAASNWTVRIALVIAQVAFGAAHFLAGAPPAGPAIGEGLPYRQRTFVQRMLTESRAMMATTAPVLRRAERELVEARAAVIEACPAGRAAALVAADGDGLNWRRVMQAFPGHFAVRIPVDASQGLFVGHEGRFQIHPRGDLHLAGPCAVVWLAPEDRRPDVGPPAGPDGRGWPVVIAAPARIRLADDAALVIDR